MSLESFCPYRAYDSYLFYPGCCPGLGASALAGRMGTSEISQLLDPIKLQKIIFYFSNIRSHSWKRFTPSSPNLARLFSAFSILFSLSR